MITIILHFLAGMIFGIILLTLWRKRKQIKFHDRIGKNHLQPFQDRIGKTHQQPKDKNRP